MPENTEVLTTKEETLAPEVEKNDSGTDSDSDDSIPELEDTGAGAQTQGNMCKQDKRKGYIFIVYDKLQTSNAQFTTCESLIFEKV